MSQYQIVEFFVCCEKATIVSFVGTCLYDNVVALVGRVSASNAENYTHALYMRFQTKENLEKFYENPFYLKVLKEHVFTYCHVCTNM